MKPIELRKEDVLSFLDREIPVALDDEREKKLTFNPRYCHYNLWHKGVRIGHTSADSLGIAVAWYNRL